MGQELKCKVRVDNKAYDGKALLETREIIFRGERSLRIPLESAKVSSAKGKLVVRHAGGEATFELGEVADDWLRRIQNPKSRVEKLGVKPGLRASVIAVSDREFIHEVGAIVTDVHDKPAKDSDLIFLGVESEKDLSALSKLIKYLKPNGALWTIRPKGSKAITEKGVMAAGKAAELVDVKVVSFSETQRRRSL